jgi:hypothetical protein
MSWANCVTASSAPVSPQPPGGRGDRFGGDDITRLNRDGRLLGGERDRRLANRRRDAYGDQAITRTPRLGRVLFAQRDHRGVNADVVISAALRMRRTGLPLCRAGPAAVCAFALRGRYIASLSDIGRA